MRDTSLGILVKKEKKFYYLETGKVYIGNTIDRLKKTLYKRNLLSFDPSGNLLDTTDHEIITCSEAKLQNYEMIPVYISKHIEKSLLETEETKSSSSWGSK
tara:strand:- start:1780 stop:2082 length:303 start_codon:yes stop_codon:yes gene_type:complete